MFLSHLHSRENPLPFMFGSKILHLFNVTDLPHAKVQLLSFAAVTLYYSFEGSLKFISLLKLL